jgi:hypothetical protein
MLSDAVIISANMRGGYVHVGTTVHTLFRMSRRSREACSESENNKTASVKGGESGSPR